MTKELIKLMKTDVMNITLILKLNMQVILGWFFLWEAYHGDFARQCLHFKLQMFCSYKFFSFTCTSMLEVVLMMQICICWVAQDRQKDYQHGDVICFTWRSTVMGQDLNEFSLLLQVQELCPANLLSLWLLSCYSITEFWLWEPCTERYRIWLDWLNRIIT